MSFPNIDTLEDILKKNLNIDKKNIKKLMSLKYNKNLDLLTLKKRNILLDIISLIDMYGFEEIYEYLKNCKNCKNINEILKNSKPFETSKTQYFLNITSYMREKENRVKSLIKCIKCKGNHVDTKLKQLRGADEAPTELNLCLDCGHRWKN